MLKQGCCSAADHSQMPWLGFCFIFLCLIEGFAVEIKKIPQHPSVGKWTLQFIASAVKLIKVSAIAIYVDIRIVKALQKATGLVLWLTNWKSFEQRMQNKWSERLILLYRKLDNFALQSTKKKKPYNGVLKSHTFRSIFLKKPSWRHLIILHTTLWACKLCSTCSVGLQI